VKPLARSGIPTWLAAQRWLPAITGLAVVLGLVLLHAERCVGCVYLDVLGSDALILAILLGLFAVNVSGAPGSIRIVANLAAALLVGLYVADMVLTTQFSTRLDLNDVVAFIGDPGSAKAILSWVGAQWGEQRMLLYALILAGLPVYVITVSRAPYLRTRRVTVGIVLVALALVALHVVMSHRTPLQGWASVNFLTVNRENGVNVAYSAAESARLSARGEQLTRRDRCFPGRRTRPSIVLVVVESLSAYHSALFSGLNDFTPRLDQVARRGLAFRRFHANGWTTEGGLIALLTGRHPMPPIGGLYVGRILTYRDFHDLPDTLPKAMRRAGYATAFLATSDLSYKNTATWLRDIGFDHVEDQAASFYAAAPRYVFNAAPDEFLYRRALDHLAAPSDRPRFVVLETVSSHSPFRDPSTGVRTEAAALRYADARLGEFVDRLEATGFFERGLLVVTADHRAMTPVRPTEWHRFGDSAPARVPLVVVGAGVPSGHVVDDPFQQIDLWPSLESIVADQYCMSRLQGNLFRPERGSAECILHVGGAQRDIVRAFCGGDTGAIRLQGDATAVVSGRLPDAAEYIAEIGHLRQPRTARTR
jgi:phosphoglycerol transferase MdoB-like AlkP superfamily enzyme